MEQSKAEKVIHKKYQDDFHLSFLMNAIYPLNQKNTFFIHNLLIIFHIR